LHLLSITPAPDELIFHRRPGLWVIEAEGKPVGFFADLFEAVDWARSLKCQPMARGVRAFPDGSWGLVYKRKVAR
jgi:hypothetical protein